MSIHNCPELMDAIQKLGFLPLLTSSILGFSADEMVAPECRYVVRDDGGWAWPLWKWKGPGFISQEWWPDFCNYRRSVHPVPERDSIEDTILLILGTNGSMITRDLRKACGCNGAKMRSRFDSYVTRLQGACRIVTEDFV